MAAGRQQGSRRPPLAPGHRVSIGRAVENSRTLRCTSYESNELGGVLAVQPFRRRDRAARVRACQAEMTRLRPLVLAGVGSSVQTAGGGGASGFCEKSKQSDMSSEALSRALIGGR